MGKPLELQIIVPTRSDGDALSDGLRWLTENIVARQPDLERGYGLGGANGYGVDYENDVFMMHHYCWCEKPDCLWCTPWLSNDTDATEQESRAHRAKQIAEAEAKFGPWITSIGYGAPNFWHKPSGFQVRWYKWIGRDNQISDNMPDLQTMLIDCLGSVPDLRATKENSNAE